MLATLLAVMALLPVPDSLYRAGLLLASRRWRLRPRPERLPERSLVLVPARDEGNAVSGTLSSIRAAAAGCEVRTVLVLDGDDPAAAAAARELGAEVVLKTPPGPSKAAVLVWAVDALTEELAWADAVWVVDVGTRLADEFFARARWPDGADGVQAFLSGAGRGPGTGAALSEHQVQRHEDCGREVLGWSVRLRGTAFALTSEAFAGTVRRLRSQIEDLEMSLLLVAAGRRLAMTPPDALAHDVKPDRVGQAARQRARWLAGQLTLPFQQPGPLLRLLVTRPLEGGGFAAELLGRPLSLSVPGRLAVAAALTWLGWTGGWTALTATAAALAGATAVFDLVYSASGEGFNVGAAAGLGLAWVRAVVLLPRAFVGWMRARKE